MPKKSFAVKKPSSTQGQGQESAILTSVLEDESIETVLMPRTTWSQNIPIDKIRPNSKQARKAFNQARLDELADSMKIHGFVTRLLVRPHPTQEDIYELVYGERRWRSARIAGLQALPCDIAIYSDDEMAEIGLLENLQREDLTNIEEGEAYDRLLAQVDGNGKSKYSIRSLAAQLGISKSRIEDMLEFARAPQDVQELASELPTVSPRIVRELARIETAEDRAPLIEAVKAGQMAVEDVREVRKSYILSTAAAAQTVVPSALASTPTIEQPELSVVQTDESQKIEQAQETNLTKEENGHHPTEPEKSRRAPLASIATAHLIFERRLHRDHKQFQTIISQWRESATMLSDEEKHRVVEELTSWQEAIQELVSLYH